MEIFISWSGSRSGAVARALHSWLPKIVNAFNPWLSSSDIEKGTRWTSDVAVRLEAAKAGIICLTPSNVHADWILFEAGALSKTLENTFVCPFLVGLEPSDIKGPLAQFQATRAIKEDVLKLVKTLNRGLGEYALQDNHIDEAFDVWWPKLETQLQKLPSDGGAVQPQRPERDILEEILSLVRTQNRPSLQRARISSRRELDDEKEREIFNAAFSVVRQFDPNITAMSVQRDGDLIECSFRQRNLQNIGFLSHLLRN